MVEYVLVFYLSVGWGNGQHGGPAVIQGFESYESCKKMEVIVKETFGSKLDESVCLRKE